MNDTLQRWVTKAVRAGRAELLDLPLAAIQNWPGRVGNALRVAYWRRRCRSVGRSFRVEPGVTIVGPEWVSFGDDVWLDRGVVLIAGPLTGGSRRVRDVTLADRRVAKGELKIGNRVHVAPHVVIQAHGGVSIGDELTLAAGTKIYSLSHHYRDPGDPSDLTPFRFVGSVPDAQQLLLEGEVVVENGAAIGLNAVLLPGARVSAEAWVAAGSVVRSVVPPRTIAGGNPAAVFKTRP